MKTGKQGLKQLMLAAAKGWRMILDIFVTITKDCFSFCSFCQRIP